MVTRHQGVIMTIAADEVLRIVEPITVSSTCIKVHCVAFAEHNILSVDR